MKSEAPSPKDLLGIGLCLPGYRMVRKFRETYGDTPIPPEKALEAFPIFDCLFVCSYVYEDKWLSNRIEEMMAARVENPPDDMPYHQGEGALKLYQYLLFRGLVSPEEVKGIALEAVLELREKEKDR